MTETTLTFHDGSTVVTTDPVDMVVLKQLMNEKTTLKYTLTTPDGTLSQAGYYIIVGIEQRFGET